MNREGKKKCMAIRKAIEKEAHRTADEFHPHYVTINGLSEKIGHPEYALQIKNRLWREIEQHEEYMNYTMIDFNHPDDLCITAGGITAFFDILSCYFDPEALTDVATYMNGLDEIDRNNLEIKRTEKRTRQIIKQAPTTVIKSFIAEYETNGTMAGIKMNDEIHDLLTDELASRKPLRLFKQGKRQAAKVNAH